MSTHCHDLGDDGFVGPLNTKDFSQLLKVMCRSFTDRENCITQPAHAKCCQLLIKELHTKLASKERDIFDDGQSNSPLLVFCKLDDRGK